MVLQRQRIRQWWRRTRHTWCNNRRNRLACIRWCDSHMAFERSIPHSTEYVQCVVHAHGIEDELRFPKIAALLEILLEPCRGLTHVPILRSDPECAQRRRLWTSMAAHQAV